MTGPKGVLLNRGFLPGWVAEDHIEPAALAQEYLGECHRKMQRMQAGESRSRMSCPFRFVDLMLLLVPVLRLEEDFGLKRLGDDDVTQSARRPHREPRFLHGPAGGIHILERGISELCELG